MVRPCCAHHRVQSQERAYRSPGAGDLDARNMPVDVIAGPADVFGEDLPQLVQPDLSLLLVGPDEGVHGEHIHGVVVGTARDSFSTRSRIQGL